MTAKLGHKFMKFIENVWFINLETLLIYHSWSSFGSSDHSSVDAKKMHFMCPKNWHWLKVSGHKCVDKYQNHYEWLCGNGMKLHTEVFIHMQVSYWAIKFVNNQLDLSVLV